MKISLGRAAFAAVVCLSFAVAFPVFSQDLDDVTISGRIVDPNGQSIVGATVTATQTETGLVRSVTTNEDGRYRLIELPPGTYKIKAEAIGFGPKERIDLVTVSGQNVQLDLALAVGGISAEIVTVGEDDTPAVDTTRTVVGGTITAREIEELPNASRNPLDLVLTLGGTSEESLSTSGLPRIADKILMERP